MNSNNQIQIEDQEWCSKDNRCEDCAHCQRSRPCECGRSECDVIGGTCEWMLEQYEKFYAKSNIKSMRNIDLSEAAKLADLVDAKLKSDKTFLSSIIIKANTKDTST